MSGRGFRRRRPRRRRSRGFWPTGRPLRRSPPANRSARAPRCLRPRCLRPRWRARAAAAAGASLAAAAHGAGRPVRRRLPRDAERGGRIARLAANLYAGRGGGGVLAQLRLGGALPLPPGSGIGAAQISCGVLVLGPNTFYPPHRHEAEEIYLPLAGTAEWLKGDGVWRHRRPGTLIHHSSEETHAMRTGEQPLLAMYLWRSADLGQNARLDPGNAE